MPIGPHYYSSLVFSAPLNSLIAINQNDRAIWLKGCLLALLYWWNVAKNGKKWKELKAWWAHMFDWGLL